MKQVLGGSVLVEKARPLGRVTKSTQDDPEQGLCSDRLRGNPRTAIVVQDFSVLAGIDVHSLQRSEITSTRMVQ